MHAFLKSLYDDHKSIIRLLDVYERELKKFATASRPDYAVLHGGIAYCAEYLDVVHHRKEEQLLRQLRLRDPDAAGQAGPLSEQHQELERLTREISTIFAAAEEDSYVPRDSLVEPARQWLAAYREHLRWEEDVLFPAAEAALSARDWATAQKDWEDIANPLHSKEKENRFAQLAEAIVSIGDS